MRIKSCRVQDTKKYCLLQTKALPLGGGIVGVEDLGNVFRRHLLLDRPIVVAAVERREIEGLHRFGLPQAQQGRVLGPVPADGRVKSHPPHHPIGVPADLNPPFSFTVSVRPPKPTRKATSGC